MNIYFFDPTHIREKYFSLLLEVLKVKSIYVLSKGVSPFIKEACSGKLLYDHAFPINIHSEEGMHNADHVVFKFVDLLRVNGELIDKFGQSSNSPLKNLRNKDLDDPNLMIIIPPVPYTCDNYNYVPQTSFPHHFAQYVLNILRKSGDDRYADRLSFVLLHSYLENISFYKRVKVLDRSGYSRSPVDCFHYTKKGLWTKYVVSCMIALYPNLKEGDIMRVNHYVKKIIKEDDYIAYHAKLEMLSKSFKYDLECKRQEYDDKCAAQEWQKEVEKMYYDAFDGDPANEWNID